MATLKDEPATVRVRCRMPAFLAMSKPFRLRNGKVATAELRWMTKGRWERRAEAKSPSWWIINLGLFIAAFRIEG